jgi:molybdenum cofactor synthesis domain-containing protein
MPGIDDKRPFVPLKIAVLTVSDTRELADDKSGGTLAERIEKAGHVVAGRTIVTDDAEKIRAQMRSWIADKGVDVIISTGGTGFTGRDVTPEAVEPLFEKRMDGFSHGQPRQDRFVDDPVARHRRRGRFDFHLLPAGFARRLPRRLGRNPRPPARLPLPAMQFRRVDAAARRKYAPRQGPGRDRVTNATA